jgi:hypothetical protein
MPSQNPRNMRMQAGDLHQLRVFVGEGASGNTTGVVGTGRGEQREAMAERARLLGYHDTAFVAIGESEVRVASRHSRRYGSARRPSSLPRPCCAHAGRSARANRSSLTLPPGPSCAARK